MTYELTTDVVDKLIENQEKIIANQRMIHEELIRFNETAATIGSQVEAFTEGGLGGMLGSLFGGTNGGD